MQALGQPTRRPCKRYSGIKGEPSPIPFENGYDPNDEVMDAEEDEDYNIVEQHHRRIVLDIHPADETDERMRS
jgi:hypothetical protein